MQKPKKENNNYLVLCHKDLDEYQCDCWSPLEDFDIINIKYNTKLIESPIIEDRYNVPREIHSITYECAECQSILKVIYDEEEIDYDEEEDC